MNYEFLLTFIALSIVNVVFSTIRSIITINGNKIVASLISGGYYAFYNIMVIYTVANFPMWQKCLITFMCNVIGVYLVKWGEEKSRKDKLWKVEATIDKADFEVNKELLNLFKVPHNYIDIEKYVILNFYCTDKKQSERVKSLLDEMNAKYFVAESKNL